VRHQARRPSIPPRRPLQQQLGARIEAPAIDLARQGVQRRRSDLGEDARRAAQRGAHVGRPNPLYSGLSESGCPDRTKYRLGISGGGREAAGGGAYPDTAGHHPASSALRTQPEPGTPPASSDRGKGYQGANSKRCSFDESRPVTHASTGLDGEPHDVLMHGERAHQRCEEPAHVARRPDRRVDRRGRAIGALNS
jgi:hypothetical protein